MCNNFNNCDLILPRGIVPDAKNRITVNFNGKKIQIDANSNYAREEWIRQVDNNGLGYFSNPNSKKVDLYRFDSKGNLYDFLTEKIAYEFVTTRICEKAIDFRANYKLPISLTGIYFNSENNEWVNILIYSHDIIQKKCMELLWNLFRIINHDIPYNGYGIAYRNANLIKGNRDREPNENEWDNRFWRFWGCEFIEYKNNNS